MFSDGGHILTEKSKKEQAGGTMEKFNVTGMSCAACSAHVEKAVAAVPGVTDVAVSLLTNQMRVEYMAPATAENICAAVTAAGYGAAPAEQGQRREAATVAALEDHATPGLVRRLIASICVLLPLMYVSMGHMLWNWPLPGFLAGNHVSVGLLSCCSPGVIMVVNQRFFVSGVQGLLHRAPNMDTLVALGASAAFLYSTAALFQASSAAMEQGMTGAAAYMDEYYFESAAMILTLITVGKTLGGVQQGEDHRCHPQPDEPDAENRHSSAGWAGGKGSGNRGQNRGHFCSAPW